MDVMPALIFHTSYRFSCIWSKRCLSVSSFLLFIFLSYACYFFHSLVSIPCDCCISQYFKKFNHSIFFLCYETYSFYDYYEFMLFISNVSDLFRCQLLSVLSVTLAIFWIWTDWLCECRLLLAYFFTLFRK